MNTRSTQPQDTLPHATAAGQPVAVPQARWSVRLLGTVEADSGAQLLNRWPSRAVALLLARLALSPGRAHSREELIELLWPGVTLSVGRNRLRQALSTLKSLLEPPGPGAVQVLSADRLTVRVTPGALACDAMWFEHYCRRPAAVRARALYVGELMPGYFDEWVNDERRRLAALWDGLAQAEALPAPPSPLPVSDSSAESEPSLPSGLPCYWTRTFGSELPASRLRALVQGHRLVTVHGPGGSGKTRLAAEVAQSLHDGPVARFDDDRPPFVRVTFSAMVACNDVTQALDALCAALRLDARDGDPHARLVTALSGWRTLLVLDNLEQLGASIGKKIATLLAALPDLHVLVTSRKLLGVDGERAFELEGLALPAAEATLTEAAASPAVTLFVDRARAARADFQLGARNVAAIVSLVRLVAGMPLAIELAASRVRGLSPRELLARLREDAGTPMLDLLARSSVRASLQARHASMRHVMAWSWSQLSPAQAQMLQTMSVLTAPASLPSIAAVAAMSGNATQSMLDELHDASLLHVSRGEDEQTRYTLLQPVREFAGQDMAAADARAARQRLRLWLIDFARTAAAQGPTAVAPELAHVYAALQSAHADAASHQGLELATALRAFWDTDALPLSCLQALEQALADVDEPDLRADALELLAMGRGEASFVAEALRHADAAVAAAPDARRRSVALARWVLTSYKAGRMDFDALAPVAVQALRLARQSGDLSAQAHALRINALLVFNLKRDFAAAEPLLVEAQQISEQAGNRSVALLSFATLATLWAWAGRIEEGLAALREYERLAHVQSDWVGQMTATRQLGRACIRARRWGEAAAAFRRSLRLARQRNHALGVMHALLHVPDATAMGSDPEAAARLHGFAVAHWVRLHGQLNQFEAAEMRRTRRLLRLRLGAPRTAALLMEGSTMALSDAVTLALVDVDQGKY